MRYVINQSLKKGMWIFSWYKSTVPTGHKKFWQFICKLSFSCKYKK